MSDYLITQLKAAPDIGVGLRTRVAGGHGQGRLEAPTLEDVRTGQGERVSASAVFVMIGAGARTQWRRDLVKLNERGLILTGRDVPPGAWPLPRPLLPFKTLQPRSGNLHATSRGGKAIACNWGRQVRRRSGRRQAGHRRS
jgi:thioredoxin reductase (NADPH)